MTEKELFVNAINNIKIQHQNNVTTSKYLAKAFPNAFQANLLPDNELITDSLIDALQYITHDNDKYIYWFCYDTNFGKTCNMIKHNDKTIIIDSAEKLYQFITNN